MRPIPAARLAALLAPLLAAPALPSEVPEETHEVRPSGGAGEVQTVWWPDGRVRQSARIVDGRAQGAVLRFYESGLPMEQETFDAGIRDGIYRSWYPDGQLFQQGTYAGGLETGRWTTWRRSGEIAEIVRVEAGRVVGVEHSSGEAIRPSQAPPSVRMRPWLRHRRILDATRP